MLGFYQERCVQPKDNVDDNNNDNNNNNNNDDDDDDDDKKFRLLSLISTLISTKTSVLPFGYFSCQNGANSFDIDKGGKSNNHNNDNNEKKKKKSSASSGIIVVGLAGIITVAISGQVQTVEGRGQQGSQDVYITPYLSRVTNLSFDWLVLVFAQTEALDSGEPKGEGPWVSSPLMAFEILTTLWAKLCHVTNRGRTDVTAYLAFRNFDLSPCSV